MKISTQWFTVVKKEESLWGIIKKGVENKVGDIIMQQKMKEENLTQNELN